MKVAIVGIYPRDPSVLRGGVEAVTLRLSEGLARLPGVEVHVVVSEPDRPLGTTRNGNGVAVHSIGGARHLGNLLFQLPDRLRIARALRELRPDIVHAHSTHREALAAIESGIPAVVTIHGLIEQEIALETRLGRRVRGWARRRLVSRVFARMRNVIVLSPAVEEHYRSRLGRARTWTIENPVDDLFFDQRREPEPGVLLFSGLVIPRKGVRNLLQALALARREAPEAKLRIAGGFPRPDYEASVREELARLDLGDAVRFLGSVPPEELAREYARATCLVLVSRQETLPVAVQEAMAVGLPVIASPVGGVPHLVRDGENGFLVPHGDPAALAERMVRLLRDRPLQERLSAAGRTLAEERFRLDDVCRRTLDVYREVLASRETTG
ncbi:MAG: glycosyltransferase family 4 protein [Candidatus Eiseniibacteriota bacterium]